MVKELSKERSMVGWKFSVWFGKNRGTLRNLAAGVLGLLVALGVDLSTAGKTGVGTAVTLVAKLALDSIDFWFSEVKLE